MSYIGDFYKAQEHNYTDFFGEATADDTQINDISKNIKKMQQELADEEVKLKEAYAKKYKGQYTPCKIISVGKYETRNGATHYYSIPSGQTIYVSDTKNFNVIKLDTKSGELQIPEGYAYDRASIIVKSYKYTISGDNSKAIFKLQDEYVVPFLEATLPVDKFGPNKAINKTNLLSNIPGKEFVNTLFDTDRELTQNLSWYYNQYHYNKSFETILKTAPDDLLDFLLKMNFTENNSIAKIIGVPNDIYELAKTRGICRELYEIAECIEMNDKFNMSPLKWLDMIAICKTAEKNLDFYNIRYNEYWYYSSYRLSQKRTRASEKAKLLGQLADAYLTYPVFYENYSFGKFVKYVSEEAINQGYSSISSFITGLKDYLNMCKDNHTKPLLYSNSIKLVHDLASRNFSIHVSPEDEEKFKSRYVDFKPVNVQVGDIEYHLIAPRNTDDIKEEGQQLCHCVCAYIKKVIDDTTRIYFLRKDIDKSLITVEVEDNKICQLKGQSNRDCTEEEIQAVKKIIEKGGFELACEL